VSDSHIVNYKNEWMPVYKHPDSIKVAYYNEQYLYCLNTTNKTIMINNIIFTDWDEIYEKDIQEIKSNKYFKINELSEIHGKLDGGFKGSTPIKIINGKYREIQNIIVGDILGNGEKVYGIVKINGKNIKDQFKFILGDNLVFEGGPNLVICDKKFPENSTLEFNKNKKYKLDDNHNKLYHLLTDTTTFYICDTKFHDYNAEIDFLLEKNRLKFLSMKYV
jgi:hypothetical protein